MISFFTADISAVPLKQRRAVKKTLQILFQQENKKVRTLDYIFTSDEYLLNINKNFLGHDFFTDVITFNLSDNSVEVTGEIYISVDRVIDNASRENVTLNQELLRVIFHGALHLCGYKDKTKSEITLMRELENKYLCFFDQ